MASAAIPITFSYLSRPGPSDATARMSVRANLGDNFGREIVGEGIEDRETWDAVRGLRCDTAQGYFTSRPLPTVALAGWLSARDPRPMEAAPA